MKPAFFASPGKLRRWFEKNHTGKRELWIGFYKKDSGKPSITWPESVDEAICFGWIDGIRKSVDQVSYKIRFTPRRKGSIWSAVNIKRVEALTKGKRMRSAGLKAFAARLENKSGIYSYEQRPTELPKPYADKFKKNNKAWKFFEAQPPGYRKLMAWYIVSAKKEETRAKRLQRLITDSARGKRLL